MEAPHVGFGRGFYLAIIDQIARIALSAQMADKAMGRAGAIGRGTRASLKCLALDQHIMAIGMAPAASK